MTGDLPILILLYLTVAYLLGCFNTGYYLVKFLKRGDIRATASGNTGSRNVGRLLGSRGFIITFLGDAGKGAAVVWFATQEGMETWQLLALLFAVVAGHIWPFQLGFRGGKGFATLFGGLIVAHPLLLLGGCILSLVFLVALRRTTIAGLLALACSPLLLIFVQTRKHQPLCCTETGVYFLLVCLVLWGHHENIRKEFYGETGMKQGKKGV